MAESSLSLLLWALGGCRDQVSEVLWAVGLGHPCVKLQGSFSAASRAELQDLRPGSEEIGAFWTWAIAAHSAADGYRNR